MKNKKFLELEHMADVKFEIFGSSSSEIFENTALAFSSYISSGVKIKSLKNVSFTLKADNLESLLYSFIDELIFFLDAKDFAVAKAKVKIDDFVLTATLLGDSIKKYHLKHVKAATYSEMYIKNSSKNWKAQIVLDV